MKVTTWIKIILLLLLTVPRLNMRPSRGKNLVSARQLTSLSNMRKQCRQNIAPALNNSTVDNSGEVFNIQLNYDIKQALDLNSWDSKFRTVSLHRLMEHSASDIKNIKESLQMMQRYILGKCQVWFTLGWKSTKWTQRCMDLWNNLGFSLCAALSICHIVTTSDDRKKSKMGVSADWCVAIEHQRLSSIRVIFIDYQTSK